MSQVRLAVWVHVWTTTCFDFGFDLHAGFPVQLTIVIHMNPCAALNAGLCFHCAFSFSESELIIVPNVEQT